MKLTLKYPLSKLIVTQYFGNRNPKYYGWGTGHSGIDLRAPHGTPIYATHDGLAYYEVDSNQGHGVVVISNDKYDNVTLGKEVKIKTIYWHMVDPDKDPKFTSPVYGSTLRSPKPVKTGDIIGYADNTGNSSGDHLHFGLKPVAEGEAPNVWYNVEQANGYNGAIDPFPFFEEPYQFTRDLKLGSTGDDVKELQKFLNDKGFTIALRGAGAVGHETKTFGKLTQDALKRAQKGWAIKPASGYFGSKTRAYVNDLIRKAI